MPSPFALTDRIAFVTGAGRGIGREIARTLADAGADVVAVGQSAPGLDESADEVRPEGGEPLADHAVPVERLGRQSSRSTRHEIVGQAVGEGERRT
jgi:NAD(P)-dependent dehydrogenase (short-subunit alcohol dehydrogenase family)